MTTRSAGEPSAELLSWDSEFWGVRIGRAPTLMDDWALENTIGCMWLLIPAHEQADIHRAEQGGARVMDLRVKLDRTVQPEFDKATRPMQASEIETVVDISRTAFRGLTRFYADPRFPDARCDDLYENWVRDSADGWAKEILVTVGSLDGFITIHGEGDTASIGLIAVAEHARGRGLGGFLTDGAVDWANKNGYEKISVVTQGCNIVAQRVFQDCDFRVVSTDVWLHQWFYPTATTYHE